MPKDKNGAPGGNAHDLQGLALPGVQGPVAGPVSNEAGDRFISLNAIRAHHLHIQSTGRASVGCRVCSEGVEGALAEAAPKPAVREDEVDEGERVNEDRGDSPSRPGWSR